MLLSLNNTTSLHLIGFASQKITHLTSLKSNILIPYLPISRFDCSIIPASKNDLTIQAPIFKSLWTAAEKEQGIRASFWIGPGLSHQTFLNWAPSSQL